MTTTTITTLIVIWAVLMTLGVVIELVRKARLRARNSRVKPTTKKSAEMERLSRRVTRIHTPDLASHLEMATVAAFESVHRWTRAVNPLEREALQAEAITAVRAQLALLEEQKRRGIS